jgi:hypothetical protein
MEIVRRHPVASAALATLLLTAIALVGIAVFDSANSSSTLTYNRAAFNSEAAPCGTAEKPPARWDHVVWIVMENTSAHEVLGSSNAPYLNTLANNCGVATKFFAETHPSLPNYIAMTSGSTHGISDDADPSSHPLSTPSIFGQLGNNWRSLAESMPSNCKRSNSGDYAVRHVPATYYTNLQCKTNVVPLRDPINLSARFTFITPNLCHDMHDCSTGTGDRWLSHWVPRITSSPQYRAGRTALFITWDEDDHSANNHIATIVISPSTKPGTKHATHFNHYSLLRTTEEMLELPKIGQAKSATSMRHAFGL